MVLEPEWRWATERWFQQHFPSGLDSFIVFGTKYTKKELQYAMQHMQLHVKKCVIFKIESTSCTSSHVSRAFPIRKKTYILHEDGGEQNSVVLTQWNCLQANTCRSMAGLIDNQSKRSITPEVCWAPKNAKMTSSKNDLQFKILENNISSKINLIHQNKSSWTIQSMNKMCKYKYIYR